MKRAGSNFNESDWDDFQHSTTESISSPEELLASYKTFESYVNSLPKGELVKQGWMKSKDDLGSLSSLFFQLHADKNQVLFRKSKEAKAPILALWLSKARANAELALHLNRVGPFEKLTKEQLRTLAQSSVDVEMVTKVTRFLAEKGVVLVFLCALPGMKTDGAVFRLASGNPAIAMSLRFARLDYFWFTLLHELSHIVLHLGHLNEPICDQLDEDGTEEIEIEANRLAKASIVDRSAWRSCDARYRPSNDAVVAFAEQIHVHPSLIAGLLRRESKDYSRFSDIVNAIDVRTLLFPS